MTSSDLPFGADGPASPPRSNGELVFDAPWQSRAFGIAAALAETGRLEWPDLQAALIARVAEADEVGLDTGTPTGYWRCWIDALGAVVSGEQGPATALLSHDDWIKRASTLAARPPGHDHHHDHHHDHDDDHHHDHDHNRQHGPA